MAQSFVRRRPIPLTFAADREAIEVNPIDKMRLVTPTPRDRVVARGEYGALVVAELATINSEVILTIRLHILQGQREAYVFEARARDSQIIEDRRFDSPPRRLGRVLYGLGLQGFKTERADWLRIHPEALDNVAAASRAIAYLTGSAWLCVLAAAAAGAFFGLLHGLICSLPRVNDIAIGIATCAACRSWDDLSHRSRDHF